MSIHELKTSMAEWISTRPSTVDKPNREARSTGPTQAPPPLAFQASPAKAATATSRKAL